MVPNIQVESSPTPLLTVDEVEQIQRQKIASLVGHVFQLTYAAMFDTRPRRKAESLPRLCYSTPKLKTTFLPRDGLRRCMVLLPR